MSPVSRAVRPWWEVKSSRGRPKRLNTAGYACDNEQYEYCGITDARLHGLVGYGHHGVDDKIQDLFCQECGHKFSARRHTALYRRKTPGRRVAEVLAAVAEVLSVAGAGRVFGHAEGTITTWLTRVGQHTAGLHTRLFTGLEPLHLQLDELRTILRNRGRVVWLWLALDARTRIIAAAGLGPRTQVT